MMATLRSLVPSPAILFFIALTVGCGSSRSKTSSVEGNVGAAPSDAAVDAVATTPTAPSDGRSYDGKGFVVHEWGTNTLVIGSDGSLQRGMHHEEEDLPSFVYDRMKQANEMEASVSVKMETPVTYFYSPSARKVSVRVEFPLGLFSQWYPRVLAYQPGLAIDDTGKWRDPYLDMSFPYFSEDCRQRVEKPHSGMLNWGEVEILGRDESPTLLDAAKDKYTWSYAREVAANAVRVSGESDRFLFYRGLGNLPMGVTITSNHDQIHLQNTDVVNRVPAVFVLNVNADHASFVRYDGVAPGAALDTVAPPAADPLDTYVTKLGDAIAASLEGNGLYRDEARAMVNTWARQWFRTPGVRVLYLAPQPWTDAQIPLTITPAPDKLVRVMVIRNEILTTDVEDQDIAQLKLFDTTPDAETAYFTDLGRFAEPRLRRAMQRSGLSPKGAVDLLAKLAGPDAIVRSE